MNDFFVCSCFSFLIYFSELRALQVLKQAVCRNILINLSLSLTQLNFHIITINLKFQSEKKMLNTRSLMSLFYC